MRNKILKEQAYRNQNARASDHGQATNLLLRQKMDALTWLTRASNFLTDSLADELIDTYRETEVPLKDLDIRDRYINQLTDSQAGLQVCHSLSYAMSPKDANLPEELRRFYDEAGITLNAVTKQSLVWPLKVIELLIYNNEQAAMCLNDGRLIELLCQVLILTGWGNTKRLLSEFRANPSVVLCTARILATVIIREDAQAKLMAQSVQPLMALVNLMKD